MSIVNTFRCDVCGALKKDANKWWVVGDCYDRDDGRGISVIPIQLANNSAEDIQHCCGRECVMKAVTEKMAEIE